MPLLSERTKKDLKEFWAVYKRSRIGIAGLALLIFFIAITILAPVIAPHDPYYEDNLAGYFAEPDWFVYFGSKAPPNVFVSLDAIAKENPTVLQPLGGSYRLTAPSKLSVKVSFAWNPPKRIWVDATLAHEEPVRVVITLERPDGKKYTLLDRASSEEVSRFVFDSWSRGVKMRLFGDPLALVENILFSEFTEEGKAVPLYGVYSFTMEVIGEPPVTVKDLNIKLYGGRFGLLGTDERGRDIWSQLIKGTWFALIIGVVAASISVSIGIFYGLISAYYGGAVDSVMMRINDILLSIPVLPLLIVLTVLLKKPSLGLIVFLVGVLTWTTIAVVSRSITLSLKETAFVEAARAVGASHARIMFRHLLPHVVPIAYAYLAINVPTAVLLEAVLSFLGLTDPTMMTWGKMLYYAQAKIENWWWVLPPGLFLIMLSISFVFVGHAIDEILNPRLRRRV